jgi:hypothetical protein
MLKHHGFVQSAPIGLSFLEISTTDKNTRLELVFAHSFDKRTDEHATCLKGEINNSCKAPIAPRGAVASKPWLSSALGTWCDTDRPNT